jgi:acetolactate synthase-1/2/3 large subunit
VKLTDLLAKKLLNAGVKDVFGLQGGAVAHIFDSLEKFKLKVTYTHHEQSASLAAVSYSKATRNLGCVVVTTGPGSTNAITGLLSAWQDSIPCIFISGQARSNHVSYGKKVRQVGTQEVNICDIVKPITKYSVFIKNKNRFEIELLKSMKIACSGRPGPVWIDIPLELQWSQVKDKNLKLIFKNSNKNYNKYINKFINKSNSCSKPLLILGMGSGFYRKDLIQLKNFINTHKIPFVTTWNAVDFFSSYHPLNLGVLGMSGQRGANKAIFEADFLLCLGTHLSIPHTTTLYKNYAPQAYKVIVNIDNNQLKNLNVNFNLKIQKDCYFFIKEIKYKKIFKKKKWNNFNRIKKMNWYYPPKKKLINSNIFIRNLTSKANPGDCIVIDGGGTALYSGFQSSIIKNNQRVICSSAISSMGTGLAESIGAYKSNKFSKIICIIGDGSFLMNIQDLQNIFQDKMNIKIILLNNNGYLAIRHTQKEFLNKRYYGTNPENGLTFPNFKRVVKAFSISYNIVDNYNKMNRVIAKVLRSKVPEVIEVKVEEDQDTLFKQGYAELRKGIFQPNPLDEMYPFNLKGPIANTNN